MAVGGEPLTCSFPVIEWTDSIDDFTDACIKEELQTKTKARKKSSRHYKHRMPAFPDLQTLLTRVDL
eukprot:scaffold43956_cov237-Amphora_coffeaeformis.AAC.1